MLRRTTALLTLLVFTACTTDTPSILTPIPPPTEESPADVIERHPESGWLLVGLAYDPVGRAELTYRDRDNVLVYVTIAVEDESLTMEARARDDRSGVTVLGDESVLTWGSSPDLRDGLLEVLGAERTYGNVTGWLEGSVGSVAYMKIHPLDQVCMSAGIAGALGGIMGLTNPQAFAVIALACGLFQLLKTTWDCPEQWDDIDCDGTPNGTDEDYVPPPPYTGNGSCIECYTRGNG